MNDRHDTPNAIPAGQLSREIIDAQRQLIELAEAERTPAPAPVVPARRRGALVAAVLALVALMAVAGLWALTSADDDAADGATELPQTVAAVDLMVEPVQGRTVVAGITEVGGDTEDSVATDADASANTKTSTRSGRTNRGNRGNRGNRSTTETETSDDGGIELGARSLGNGLPGVGTRTGTTGSTNDFADLEAGDAFDGRRK